MVPLPRHFHGQPDCSASGVLKRDGPVLAGLRLGLRLGLGVCPVPVKAESGVATSEYN